MDVPTIFFEVMVMGIVIMRVDRFHVCISADGTSTMNFSIWSSVIRNLMDVGSRPPTPTSLFDLGLGYLTVTTLSHR